MFQKNRQNFSEKNPEKALKKIHQAPSIFQKKFHTIS
jgi:hypothetical protein